MLFILFFSFTIAACDFALAKNNNKKQFSRPIALKWEGIENLIAGEIEFKEGQSKGTFSLLLPDKSRTKCSGTYIFKTRTTGTWKIKCDNARYANGTFVTHGENAGASGVGRDNFGESVTFTVAGLRSNEAEEPPAALSAKELCSNALESGGENWKKHLESQKFVAESARRGFSIRKCREQAGIRNTDSKSISQRMALSEAKRECELIGFKKKTQKFGICVIQLLD